MKLLQLACLIAILGPPIAAPSQTAVYRNGDYGISLNIPKEVLLCPVTEDQASHGASFLVGTDDVKLCKQSNDKRWISVFAGYNAADVSKTLRSFLTWQCENEAKGPCGPAPADLRIHGVLTQAARIDHRNAAIQIIVVAQAGKPDPDFDPTVPSINYEFSLHTDTGHLAADLGAFRRLLNTVRIAPQGR